MSLLTKIEDHRRNECERARLETVRRLRLALAELVPGQPVLVFGSVLRMGQFREDSDVDIGLLSEPSSMSEYRLQGELEERLRRRVDVVFLAECRFSDKIQQEGEIWTSGA